MKFKLFVAFWITAVIALIYLTISQHHDTIRRRARHEGWMAGYSEAEKAYTNIIESYYRVR